MVIRAGWANTKSALLELADVSVDNEIKSSVRRAATKALTGDPAKGIEPVGYGDQVQVRDVQGLKSGQNYLIDIELAVPEDFTLQQMEAIENAVRERAGAKVRGVRRVRVKFVAIEDTTANLADDFIPATVSPRSSPEPEDEDEHNHDHHDHDHGHPHRDQAKDKMNGQAAHHHSSHAETAAERKKDS